VEKGEGGCCRVRIIYGKVGIFVGRFQLVGFFSLGYWGLIFALMGLGRAGRAQARFCVVAD